MTRKNAQLPLERFYPKSLYVPMPEMHNERIPVTAGCNYNRCRFCDLNALQPFEFFPLADILAYIEERGKFYQGKRFQPQKFTLLEGNALCAPTDELLQIMDAVRANYQNVKYISSFARSYDVLRKPLADLERLHAAGLDRLSIGIESGDPQVLKFQRKGVTPAQQLAALHKLTAAGIQYSTYIMLGLGGLERSEQHALATANFLNQTEAFELTVVTLVLFKGAELVQLVRQGAFTRLLPLETLQEERLLLSHLDLDTIFNGTHPTNAFPLKGKLPEQQATLLKLLDQEIAQADEKELHRAEVRKWRDIRIQ